MKCIQCGYFNLPQALTCGRCGLDLARPVPCAGGSLQESLYPPRARERPLGAQVRMRLHLPSVPLVSLPASIQASTWPWLVMTAALMPGGGHFLLRDWRRGAVFLGATLATLGLIVLTLYSVVSDLLVWAVFGIACGSMWDAAHRTFPAAPADGEAEAMRLLRLALLSVAQVAGAVAGLCWLAGRWYPRYEITTDQMAPALQPGDDVLTRRMSHPPLSDFRRGDVVVAGAGDYPIIERIVGLPGDRVRSVDGALTVNGRLVGTDGRPLGDRWAASSFDAVVPAGQVCLWRAGALTGDDGIVISRGTSSFTTLDAVDVEGRVLAILEPPARRRRMDR